MARQALLYLPVLHAGHVDFFARNGDIDGVLLVGRGFAQEFRTVEKEIRAVSPALAVELVRAATGLSARVVEPSDIVDAIGNDDLVIPDDELLRAIVDGYGLAAGREIRWDSTFLRWDRAWSRPQPVDGVEPMAVVPDAVRASMRRAVELAERSSDWWRQVGAVVRLPDGTTLEAWNRHHPTEHAPYIDGDPRNEHSRGERTDLSTAMHAEASLVAQAAREGLSLRGAEIYVTTFPCPTCARLIGEAGVSVCYFDTPYSELAGDRILRSFGVELHWVRREPADLAEPHP